MRKHLLDSDSQVHQAHRSLVGQPPMDGVRAEQIESPVYAHRHLREVVGRGVGQYFNDGIVRGKLPQSATEVLDDPRRVLQRSHGPLQRINKRSTRLCHTLAIEMSVYQEVAEFPTGVE